MNVAIFEHGTWAAVYVDGKLASWKSSPSCVEACRLLGAEVALGEMPDSFVNEMYAAKNGCFGWAPPETLEEFRLKSDAAVAENLEREIVGVKTLLAELESRRAELRHAAIVTNDEEGS